MQFYLRLLWVYLFGIFCASTVEAEVETTYSTRLEDVPRESEEPNGVALLLFGGIVPFDGSATI